MNATRTNHRRPLAAVGLALAAVAFLVLVPTLPASAHGGPGKIEVLSTTPRPDGASVDVKVRLTFAEDGDAVDAATVTVTGELVGAGGTSPAFTPVTLAAGEEAGTFAGTVALPSAGNWSLRITSVEPPASVTVPVATAATSGGAVTSAPTTVATTASTSASTSAPTSGQPTTSATAKASNPVTGGRRMLPVVGWPAVGFAAAVAVAVAIRRRRPPTVDGE